MSKVFISFVWQGGSELLSEQVMESHKLVKNVLDQNPKISFGDIKTDIVSVGKNPNYAYASYLLSAYVDESPEDLIAEICETAIKVAQVRRVFGISTDYNGGMSAYFALIDGIVEKYQANELECGKEECYEVTTVDILAALQILEIPASPSLDLDPKGSSGMITLFT